MLVISFADCIGVPNNLKLYRLTDIELHRLNAKHIRDRTGRLTICESVKCWLTFGSLLQRSLLPAPLLKRLGLATVTIALSWAAVHTTFALHYAHDYYRGDQPGGLQFPSGDQHDHADYWDFVYFSFVIGMTAQVSDVGITDKTIRRTATAHGIISFFFNTALLALMVNIAASAI